METKICKRCNIEKNISESLHEVDKDLLANIENDGIDDSFEPFEPEAEKSEADSYSPEIFDNVLSAEVLLPQGDLNRLARSLVESVMLISTQLGVIIVILF